MVFMGWPEMRPQQALVFKPGHPGHNGDREMALHRTYLGIRGHVTH
jgi:hypothetical protein